MRTKDGHDARMSKKDHTKVEENIYEPAPGELTLKNERSKTIDEISCSNVEENLRYI